jgi:S-adenosylmethionine synthetase
MNSQELEIKKIYSRINSPIRLTINRPRELIKQKTIEHEESEELLEKVLKNLDESIEYFKKTNDKIGEAKSSFLKYELLISYRPNDVKESMCVHLN